MYSLLLTSSNVDTLYPVGICGTAFVIILSFHPVCQDTKYIQVEDMKPCLNFLYLRAILQMFLIQLKLTNLVLSTCGAATSTCTVDLTEQISGMCVGETSCSIPLIGNLGDCSGLPGQVGPGSIFMSF